MATWLLVLGMAGQVIFTLRFVLQWMYSEKKKGIIAAAEVLGGEPGWFCNDHCLRHHQERSRIDRGSVIRLCYIFSEHNPH